MPFFYGLMIELKEITFSYPSGRGLAKPLFEGLNLFIPQGRYVVLMGPNGSGKSTLGKLIKGLLAPIMGKVLINGYPLKPEEISPRVGYLSSNPENQIVSTIVEEDVAFGLENLGMDPSTIDRRVQESLFWLGMDKYRYHSPYLLSGGEQQKIVLAGILVMGYDILILDEPMAMLDNKDRTEILDLLKKIHGKGGMTLLHITHSLKDALFAQDLLLLDCGRIIYYGGVEEFLSQASFSPSAGLVLPPLCRLIRELKNKGHAIPFGDGSIEEIERHLLAGDEYLPGDF